MHQITIRHSEEFDLDAVKRIYEGPKAIAGTLQVPFPSRETWRKRLCDLPVGMYSLVAEIDGEVVGQLGLETIQRPRRRHVGHVGVVVKDSHQGQGIGSALLAASIELAENWLNISRIELGVYVDNEAAIALYKKYGFKIEGEAIRDAFRNGEYVNVYHMARLGNNLKD